MLKAVIIAICCMVFFGCSNRRTVTSPDMSNIQYASPSPDEGAAPGVPITNETLIKDALTQTLNTTSIEVTITADEGEYAAGKVKLLDTSQELQWYAVKEKGGWQIISARTDLIRCSEITDFPDFPLTLVPQCQTDQGQILNR